MHEISEKVGGLWKTDFVIHYFDYVRRPVTNNYNVVGRCVRQNHPKDKAIWALAKAGHRITAVVHRRTRWQALSSNCLTNPTVQLLR